MKTVRLCGPKAAGRVAFVDDADYVLVMAYRWYVRECVLPSGTLDGPYAVTWIRRGSRRTSLMMHVLIMGHRGIDHINHNGLDNQRHNLRAADNIRNGQNSRKRPNATSRYKGVNFDRRLGCYHARITIERKTRSLGLYDREEDAARAYDAAAREAFGEFAWLNFP